MEAEIFASGSDRKTTTLTTLIESVNSDTFGQARCPMYRHFARQLTEEVNAICMQGRNQRR